MKKKIMAGAVLLLAASIFIGGCGIKSVSTDTGAGYTVTDATGREVKIPKKPERIMGNSASIDTMLLGVVTPDKLIAATEADRDPAISYIANDTKNIKMTVPLMGLSMELVTEAKPDLIIASTYTKGEQLDLYRNMASPSSSSRGRARLKRWKATSASSPLLRVKRKEARRSSRRWMKCSQSRTNVCPRRKERNPSSSSFPR